MIIDIERRKRELSESLRKKLNRDRELMKKFEEKMRKVVIM